MAPTVTQAGGSSGQDMDWEDPSWPSERPIGEPGRVDTFTALEVGLRPATLERLRAGRDVELIVEYVSPNLPANADDTTIRRGQRLNKADVLYELQALDVEEVRDYSHLPMNVLRVRSLQAVEALRHDPRVKAVHEIGFKYLQLNQSLPLIHQPTAYGLGATGSGTTVAVLDTGVDYTESAFGSCTAPGGSCKVVYAQDFPADDGSRDDNGHGTNVAGIVLGVASQAKIAALDVFRPAGRAFDSDIIAALNWSLANRATYNIVAVNLSLGGYDKYTAPCVGSSYDAAFSNLREAGIFIAVASGNEGYSDGIGDPACVPGAVSVGAVYDADVGSSTWGTSPNTCTDSVTAADMVTCFSNSADFLSLLAPGALIDAAGREMGGTSQAAPHVAGAAAALKSVCSPATPDNILSALQASGTSVTDTRNGITKPRIDVAAATQRLTSTIDCGGGGTAKPDLIITAVSSPTSGTAGSSIPVSTTIKNQGTAAAGAFRVGYYLSTDSSITTSDVDTNWGCYVSSLAPGETFPCSGRVDIPATLATGSYYLGAYADKYAQISESNESNNGLAASNTIYITGTGGGQPRAEDYYRKVNAYFYGTFGWSATSSELATWGAVLRDNNGSVWKPEGEGLQPYLSDRMGWGTAPLDSKTAADRVNEVLGNLFGSFWDIDPRITNYYVNALVTGSIRERGLVNAILNDLAIMPRVDGTYGKPNGWVGGPGDGLLTSAQFARYRERVEDFYWLYSNQESRTNVERTSPVPD